MPITRKILAAYDWVTVFEGPGIKVMAAKGNRNVHVLHAKKAPKSGGGAARVRIEYNVFGRRFSSPSEAIKYYNATEAKLVKEAYRIGGRHPAGTGSQPIIPLTRVLPRR